LLGWLCLRHIVDVIAHRVAVKIFGKNSLPTPNESAQRIQRLEATTASFAGQVSNQISRDIRTMGQQVRAGEIPLTFAVNTEVERQNLEALLARVANTQARPRVVVSEKGKGSSR